MVKKTVVKGRSRSATATTLVKLHLPTTIRNRLRMYAIEQGVKIVDVFTGRSEDDSRATSILSGIPFWTGSMDLILPSLWYLT